MIEFTDVSYAFPDGTVALHDVSLTISPGEHVAVVGNNGSGKTTLAMLINGILKATSGRIRVLGLNPSDERDSRTLKQKVGLVFQNPDNQLVATTVEREIAFSLENMNVGPDEMAARVNKIIGLFDLSRFRKKITSELSGGEKQRLALASIMISEPEILILDEPASYLDESGRRMLDESLGMLLVEKKELTVIRITQYSRIASRHRRLIVFAGGSILYDDSPEEVFSRLEKGDQIGIKLPLEYRLKKKIQTAPARPPSGSQPEKAAERPRSLVLESVSFAYDNGPDRLFDNLDIKIDSGKIYGLVGPSGSGKTTLLQIMSRLLKPLTGQVRLLGPEAGESRPAISFQQPERQFFLPTVDREIRFGPENLQFQDIDKIVEPVYPMVGLDRNLYAGRNPFTLSGGEKRRVAFAAILSMKPAFVFFDEPTCALDATGIDLFEKLARKLRDENVGVVIVSHFGDIILDLTDEVFVMRHGRLVHSGLTPSFFREVDYSDYLSTPELVGYQIQRFGEIRYYSEDQIPPE